MYVCLSVCLCMYVCLSVCLSVCMYVWSMYLGLQKIKKISSTPSVLLFLGAHLTSYVFWSLSPKKLVVNFMPSTAARDFLSLPHHHLHPHRHGDVHRHRFSAMFLWGILSKPFKKQSDLVFGICRGLMVLVVLFKVFEGVLKAFVGAKFHIKRAHRTQKLT